MYNPHVYVYLLVLLEELVIVEELLEVADDDENVEVKLVVVLDEDVLDEDCVVLGLVLKLFTLVERGAATGRG